MSTIRTQKYLLACSGLLFLEFSYARSSYAAKIPFPCEVRLLAKQEREELHDLIIQAENEVLSSILSLREVRDGSAELNRAGIIAIDELEIYATDGIPTVLPSILHGPNFGKATRKAAARAIETIQRRSQILGSHRLTAAQLKMIANWASEAQLKGYLTTPPAGELTFEMALVLWDRLTHPMARFQLLQLQPRLMDRPGVELRIIANTRIRDTLKLLRENPATYDINKSFANDQAALRYLLDHCASSDRCLELNREYVRLTRGIPRPQLETETAEKYLNNLKSTGTNPLRGEQLTQIHQEVDHSSGKLQSTLDLRLYLELPPQILAQIQDVNYVLKDGQERSCLGGADEKFKYDFPTNPIVADGTAPCSVQILLKDRSLVVFDVILESIH